MFATPATAWEPYTADAPSVRKSTRSIIDMGNWLISKNWLPPPSATAETPPLRPLIKVKVDPRPNPRKLNCAVPIKAPDSV